MDQQDRRIRVNGNWATTEAVTLAALLESLQVAGKRAGTAVAVNGALVRQPRWPEIELHNGDTVEIIQPVQGGSGAP